MSGWVANMNGRIHKTRKLHVNLTMLLRVFLLTALLGGCASQPPQVPITDSTERLVFNGFSVLPPEGENWNWVGRPGQDKSSFYNTTFVKKDGDRTYVARVMLADTGGEDYRDLEKLIDWLKTSEMLQEGPRQKGIAYDLKKDSTLGTPCVRYDFDAEDTRPAKRPGMVFNLDGHGLTCPHPAASDVIVQIGYSRRSPKGTPYVAGLNEGERFLESVEFTPVRR